MSPTASKYPKMITQLYNHSRDRTMFCPYSLPFKLTSLLTAIAFLCTSLLPVYASSLETLPQPDQFVTLSASFNPSSLRGLRFYPDDPLKFDFIIDEGDSKLTQEELKEVSAKLIRHFLASLTIPEQDLWVNLSPAEKDKVIPPEFGLTEMGQGLLGQDYLLKQLVSSLTYPDSSEGKQFWDRVYEKAAQLFGTTNIPINTYNKIWIVPDKAEVFEADTKAILGKTHLRVMLEEDYLILKENLNNPDNKRFKLKEQDIKQINNFSSKVMREVVLPEIEKEINQGKTFQELRQIYHSLILATWFKQKLKNSLLNQAYFDQKKTKGIDSNDPQTKEKIYQLYLQAYKQGLYDYIKKDTDPASGKAIKRRYFSGGFDGTQTSSAIVASSLSKLPNNLLEGTHTYDVVEVMLAATRIEVSTAGAPVVAEDKDAFLFATPVEQKKTVSSQAASLLENNKLTAASSLTKGLKNLTEKIILNWKLWRFSKGHYASDSGSITITPLAWIGIIATVPFVMVDSTFAYQTDKDYLEAVSLAQNNPFGFFNSSTLWLDKPWKEEVIKIAVASIVEKNARRTLEFAFEYMKLPYGDQVIKAAAEKDPVSALEFTKEYADQPYADGIIEKAARFIADRSPHFAIVFARRYANKPYAYEVIKKATEREPGAALELADAYANQPYADEIIEKAARITGDIDPQRALMLVRVYANKPYEYEVIKKAAEENPIAALKFADVYANRPYADEIIEKATEESPQSVVKYSDLESVKLLLHNSERPAIKSIRDIINSNYSALAKEEMALLLHKIVINGMTLEEAIDIRNNEEAFFNALVEIISQQEPLGKYDINDYFTTVALRKVRNINDLHNESDAIRFKLVENATVKELYTLMVYGEQEIFTSSFNGLFNRMLMRMQKNKLSGDKLLESIGYNKFRIFIKLMANFGRLNDFLNTMDKPTSQNLLEKFIADIDQAKDKLSEAVVVADTFAAINDVHTLGVLQAKIKTEYERIEQKAGDSESKIIYGLLAGMFGQKTVINEEWLMEMASKYKLTDLTKVSLDRLFIQGINIQQYFFYDDKDGEASFESFLSRYRKKKGWLITEKKNLVHVTSSDKKIEIYANKPSKENQGQEEISQILNERGLSATVVVHRGHSYHAGKTIKQISPNAVILVLGSCGGYANVKPVVYKVSGEVHFIATKSTGTMLVNDPLLEMLNEDIRKGNDIYWSSFWKEAEKKLGGNGDFRNYVPPHKNLGILFIKAYKEQVRVASSSLEAGKDISSSTIETNKSISSPLEKPSLNEAIAALREAEQKEYDIRNGKPLDEALKLISEADQLLTITEAYPGNLDRHDSWLLDKTKSNLERQKKALEFELKVKSTASERGRSFLEINGWLVPVLPGLEDDSVKYIAHSTNFEAIFDILKAGGLGGNGNITYFNSGASGQAARSRINYKPGIVNLVFDSKLLRDNGVSFGIGEGFTSDFLPLIYLVKSAKRHVVDSVLNIVEAKGEIVTEELKQELTLALGYNSWQKLVEDLDIKETLSTGSDSSVASPLAGPPVSSAVNTLETTAMRSPGGIDLNPAALNLEVKGNSASSAVAPAFKAIPIDPSTSLRVNLATFQGFTFQIIKLEPLEDLEKLIAG